MSVRVKKYEHLMDDKTIDLFSFVPFVDFSKKISFDEYLMADFIVLGHMTTSSFLEDILTKGLLPPAITKKYSNKYLFENGDENYIYLAGQMDKVYSENAIQTFQGEEVLLLIKIERESIELDNLNKFYSKQNIHLQDQEILYRVLTTLTYDCKCRTKKHIPPSDIIDVFKIKDLYNSRTFNIARKIGIRITYSGHGQIISEEIKHNYITS